MTLSHKFCYNYFKKHSNTLGPTLITLPVVDNHFNYWPKMLEAFLSLKTESPYSFRDLTFSRLMYVWLRTILVGFIRGKIPDKH